MKLHQDVAFCASADGTRVATAACGAGPVILRAAHWLSHVTYDLDSPVWRPWVEALSRPHRYVRYDPRGCGMSERHCADLSLAAWQQDLEAVAGTIREDQFVLLGVSQGGALAVEFAVRHPERVSQLVLFNAYAQGGRARARNDSETTEQHRWWGDLERETATPEVASETLRQMQGMDVLDLCAQVHVPTLVLSCRNDARVPFEQGAKLAAAIPGARFVPLDSANHVLLPEEPAWVTFHGELAAFLGDTAPAVPVPRQAGLTEAEAEVLCLLAEGLGDRSIARRLGKSEKAVRNQVSVVLCKFGVQSRAQAIVRALEA